MAVAAGFIERAEVPQAFFGPKLSAALEAALLLAACRFDGPRANGPASFCDRLVVHPTGMRFKVVFFASNHLASFTASFLELNNLAQYSLFLTVSQLVSEGLNPLRELRLGFSVQSTSQTPQVFATVIKVQKFHRTVPAILLEVPHPFGSITQ